MSNIKRVSIRAADLDSSVPAVTVTGEAQRAAWRQRLLPPVEQVRGGLWSVPVPIPRHPLRYTLCYVFADDSGVVLVDPGWDSDESRSALTSGLAGFGATPADVSGIVLTHVHPDHHGLSGWLRETSGAWIAMHPAEAETLPARAWQGKTRDTDLDWLRDGGVPEHEIATLAMTDQRIAGMLAMAEPDRAIEDGDLLTIAGHEVHAIWTPGHTPGHLCLHDATAGALLTGDHLLPRISPHIGVHLATSDDPLHRYLASLELLARFADAEALPAHEYRFRGIDARAAELIRHHHERAQETLAAVDALVEPTAWQVAARLAWSRGWQSLHGLLRRMALAETVAHLAYLAASGAITPLAGSPTRWRRTIAEA
jgi:glyoxylase-like metal-dependent hydrolase (beta-lactamase superfamily II)